MPKKVSRHTRGLTLLELLAVLLILAVVLGIAFPAVAALRKSLKFNELNAAARHIFIAAQNQLTSLRAAGSGDDFSARPLTGEPSDYTGRNWTSLSYLSSADPSMARLLPPGSIEADLAKGFYIVEFDSATAAVYAVFYSEEAFSYDSTATPRETAARRNHTPMLGYYGGAVLETGGTGELSNPRVTVYNGETLYISMQTPNPFGGKMTDAAFFSSLTYLVTVRSAANPSQFRTFSTDASDPSSACFTVDYAGYSYSLLLDSLAEGGHFSQICPGITPGDNLFITVTVSYRGPGGNPAPASATVETNSLFASRTGDTVAVGAGRHLQNLEPTVSGVTTVTGVVQIADIDWSFYSAAFVPISNSQLTSYDGRGLTIARLRAGANGDSSGLFGTFGGGSLTGIRLTDAVILGSAYSGGLAGRCTGPTTVTGCALFVTDLANLSRYTVSGTDYVGGLIGRATQLTISDSFAAPARVYGGSACRYLGGLVGACGGESVITRCYADTEVRGDASPNLGGLAGHCGSNSQITDCYALGNLSSVGATYFGGLVGGSLSATFTNCYAAPTFDGTGGASTPYGIAGSGGNTYVNCTALQSSGFAKVDPSDSFEAVTYSVLQNWKGGDAWSPASAASSHPYDPMLQGAAYPFPRLKTLDHYNDWPDKPVLPLTVSLTYYERYQDGTVGYYATDSNGRVAVNTLSDVKGPVVFDGYCLLSLSPLETRNFKFESREEEKDATFDDMGSVTIRQDGQTMTYRAYGIPRWVLLWDDYSTVDFYVYIRHQDKIYWYNPHFAKAAVNGSTVRPVFHNLVSVRASRHLAAIGSDIYTSYLDARFTFRQELDLDFDLYPAAVMFTIGSEELPFQGDYYGNGYRVVLNNSSSASRAALFRYNAGTIRDMNVYTSGSFFMGDTYIISGVLTATNTGTVRNCTVTVGSGMTVRGTPFGGIAGINTGKLEQCVVRYSGNITVTSGSGFPAGFVGENRGTVTDGLVLGAGGVAFSAGNTTMSGFAGSNSGLIYRCFVRPDNGRYDGFSVSTTRQAVGFVHTNSGTVTDCSVTGVFQGGAFSECYAAGFAHTNTGTIANSYANCLVTAYHASGFAFVSSSPDAVIRNCYFMLQVTADSTNGIASGFVQQGGPGVTRCYTAARVEGRTSYTFTGDISGEDCYYVSWRYCGYLRTGTGVDVAGLAEAFGSDPQNWGGGEVYPFQDVYTDLTLPCPYPTVTGLAHYGDWLNEPYYVPPIPMLAYYERYSDGSYGYYTLSADGVTPFYDTLSQDKGAAVADGYLMLSPQPFDYRNRNFTFQTAGGTYTVWSEDLGAVTLDYFGTAETFYRYSIPTYAYSMWDYAGSEFYQTILIDGITYWYNPHFAKAAVIGASAIPAFGGTAYVRTPRHLASLANSAFSVYWNEGFTYLQELDLDFSVYPVGYLTTSIGNTQALPFRGTYDGGDYAIIIHSGAKDSRNALFGYNAGTLKHIRLVTKGSFRMGDSGAVSGVLAAVNSGSIRNCSVVLGANLTLSGASFGILAGRNAGTIDQCLVTGAQGAAVTVNCGGSMGGGLAGDNTGSITRSYVRPGSDAYQALTFSGTSRLAGFVYTNTGSISQCAVTAVVNTGTGEGRYSAGFVMTNNGTITGSYANCLVTGRLAAGFVHDSSGADAVIAHCYAMGSVTGAGASGGGAAGFVYAPGSRISHCYTAAQVTGYVSYTFSGSGSVGENCRYYAWSGSGGISTGIASTLSQLQQAFSAPPWGEAATHVYRSLYPSLPDACPFPLLADLDHYGDWIP